MCRHFWGSPLRPSEASGPTPPTSWRAQGVGRWRPHGRRGCTRPTGRPTPPGPRQEAEKASPLATRVVHPTSRGLRAGPPAARQTPPPSPAAEAQAQSQDVRRGERRRSARAERCRSRRLRTHSSASRLCPAAWAYDSQVQTCRYFRTGVVRPVSLYLWGRTCAGGLADCEGGEVVAVHHAQWHLPQTWIERLKNAWSSR